MKNNSLFRLVLASMFAAVTFIATALLPIPTGIGYANLGDTFALAGAFVLGPVYGFFAAAIGSALADLILGYGIYIPATFIIKGLMALVFCLVLSLMGRRFSSVISTFVAALGAEALMVFGYFTFESLIYSTEGALAGIVGNLVQGAVGIICSSVIIFVLSSNKHIRRYSCLQKHQ